MRFLSDLEFDVLAFCIIENLAAPDKQQLKVGSFIIEIFKDILSSDLKNFLGITAIMKCHKQKGFTTSFLFSNGLCLYAGNWWVSFTVVAISRYFHGSSVSKVQYWVDRHHAVHCESVKECAEVWVDNGFICFYQISFLEPLSSLFSYFLSLVRFMNFIQNIHCIAFTSFFGRHI